jgi:peptidoglycan hydrolase-like protein with peptidoglycan-binding domain
MGKHGHRAAWIAGTAVGAAAIVAAVLLLKNKNANASPALPPTPSPAGGPLTNVQQTAVDMNNAITNDGYVQADMDTYKAFQTAAGLTADGYPGTNTYNALISALASINPPVAPSSNLNAAYTFSAAGGYNGTTAPTEQQWFGPGPAPAGGYPAIGS